MMGLHLTVLGIEADVQNTKYKLVLQIGVYLPRVIFVAFQSIRWWSWAVRQFGIYFVELKFDCLHNVYSLLCSRMKTTCTMIDEVHTTLFYIVDMPVNHHTQLWTLRWYGCV